MPNLAVQFQRGALHGLQLLAGLIQQGVVDAMEGTVD